MKILGEIFCVPSSSGGGATVNNKDWIIGETSISGYPPTTTINFTFSYNNTIKNGIKIYYSNSYLCYDTDSGETLKPYGYDVDKWFYGFGHEISFETNPSAELLAWLEVNGTKQ